MNTKTLFPIIVGITCVAVFREDIDEHTKRVTVSQIHDGIVVQDLGTQVRVFNPGPRDKGGDATQETSEVFALQGARIWCEPLEPRKRVLPIASALRAKRTCETQKTVS